MDTEGRHTIVDRSGWPPFVVVHRVIRLVTAVPSNRTDRVELSRVLLAMKATELSSLGVIHPAPLVVLFAHHAFNLGAWGLGQTALQHAEEKADLVAKVKMTPEHLILRVWGCGQLPLPLWSSFTEDAKVFLADGHELLSVCSISSRICYCWRVYWLCHSIKYNTQRL